MPARLADGLGLGSALSLFKGIRPKFWVPHIRTLEIARISATIDYFKKSHNYGCKIKMELFIKKINFGLFNVEFILSNNKLIIKLSLLNLK